MNKPVPQKWKDKGWLRAKYLFKFVGRWKIPKYTFEKCEKAVESLLSQAEVKFFDNALEPSMLIIADGNDNNKIPVDFPSGAWEKLREEVQKHAGVRNKTMMARVPGPYESTAAVMSGTSAGIYPVRDSNYLQAGNGETRYYQNSKRDGESG